jgi:hypothetical protein
MGAAQQFRRRGPVAADCGFQTNLMVIGPGRTLQLIALQGRIELVPSQSPAALRGFLQGKNTFQREGDRL